MSSSLIDPLIQGGLHQAEAAAKPSGLSRHLLRRWPIVLAVAAGLLVWLALIDFHLVNPPPRSLDGSWEQALGYFCKNHYQAGADYLFTVGPLGYFLTGPYDADLFWYKFGWELVVKLAFTLTFWQLLAAYPSWVARSAAVIVLLLSANLIRAIPDTHYTFFFLAQGVLLVRSRGRPFGAARAAGVALIALLSLTKFTFFLLALATLLVVAATELTAGRRLKALLPVLAFGGMFVAGWSALGQSPANLPAFVRGSWQISAGYTEAMALSGGRAEILVALAILLLLAVALVPRPGAWRFRVGRMANPSGQPDGLAIRPTHLYLRAGALPAGLLIGLGLFLEWKHGFVRQDQHVGGFLGLALLAPLLFPVAFPTYRWLSVRRGLVFAAVWLLAGFGTIWNLQSHSLDYPHGVRQFLDDSRQAIRANAETILHPIRRREELDQEQACLDAEYQLPRIKAAVGDAPVDVFSFEQGVLFRNHLNWRPRPVFQSYAAYTPDLLRANADFYAGPRAPAFVMYKLQPCDDRLPMLEDGPALLRLLSRYRPVLVEKGYLLLQRTEAPAPPIARRLVQEQVIRMSEEIPLDDPAGGLQWLSLDVQPSAVGKIWGVLYKPHLLYIRLKTDDGQALLYRLVPGMARAGFLLNPLVLTAADVIQLYGAAPGRRIVSFCVVAQPHGPSCYRPEIRMTLECLPDLRPRLPAEEINRLRFPAFQTYPEAVQSSVMVQMAESDGRDVVLVHPEGQMRFSLSSKAHRLSAGYGIVAEAYQTGWTEGVLFVVEYHPEAGPVRVLFRRALEPRTRPGDRGPHELDLPLPTSGSGTLVLRTTAIPGKCTDCGWSYWSGVRIQ